MVAAPPGSDLCGKTAIESSRDTALRLKLGSCETMTKFHDSIFLLERFSHSPWRASTKSGFVRVLVGSAVIRNLRGVTPVALWKTLLK